MSRGYGSNLPTSLTYIVLSTRGCSPWRPAADMGTAWHEHHTVSPGFSRADESAPDTTGSAVLCGGILPFSGQTDSRECAPLTEEKRTLSGTPAGVSWFVRVTALPPIVTEGRSPCPGSGMLARFPFDHSGGVIGKNQAPHLLNGTGHCLRTD